MSISELFLLGITHTTAPLAVRERLALDDAERGALLAELAGLTRESAAIVTCNRTELYALASVDDAPRHALGLLARQSGLPVTALEPVIERSTGEDAARHLFRVAAGLESLVVGEAQVLGQVREAAAAARAAGTAGPVLTKLFNLAVAAGKRARAETAIGRGAGSVSHAAVELARNLLGDLRGKHALVIGLGEMGQIVARNLVAHGARDLAVCNRTAERAERVARLLGGRAVPWERLDDALTAADVVVTATGARVPMLSTQRMSRVAARREGRPLLLIDIALPRDVEAGVAGLPGIHLRDLDALQAVRTENLRAREDVVPQVEAIIDQEVAAFLTWWQGREVLPVIRGLRERVEAIREAEVEKALRRLGHLDARDREIVLALSHGLANKFLHQPVTRLKESAARDEYARAVADLFELPDGETG